MRVSFGLAVLRAGVCGPGCMRCGSRRDRLEMRALTFTPIRRDGKNLLRGGEIGGAHVLGRTVDYSIGSGNHARCCLTVAGDLILVNTVRSVHTGLGSVTARSEIPSALQRAPSSGSSIFC